MSATLDKIIEEVRALTPEEQRQLVEQLNAIIPSSSEDEREATFKQELAAKGIISLPDPASRKEAEAEFDDYEPITVEGQPLSEMIVEERR